MTAGLASAFMAKAQAKPKDPREEVICEKGRHVNCLHAKMAAKRTTP